MPPGAHDTRTPPQIVDAAAVPGAALEAFVAQELERWGFSVSMRQGTLIASTEPHEFAVPIMEVENRYDGVQFHLAAVDGPEHRCGLDDLDLLAVVAGAEILDLLERAFPLMLHSPEREEVAAFLRAHGRLGGET